MLSPMHFKTFLLLAVSYNPLERREACKGGKEASKRPASSQSSMRSSTAALKPQPTHNGRRNDALVGSVNAPPKAPKPAYTMPAFDEQVFSLLTD